MAAVAHTVGGSAATTSEFASKRTSATDMSGWVPKVSELAETFEPLGTRF